MKNKPIKIVFTGGPCRGKTEVTEVLSILGLKTVAETAREVIRKIQEEKIEIDHQSVEEIIFEEQLKVESGLDPNEVYFLDRGILDCGAYLKIHGDKKNLIEKVKQFGKGRYDLVFLLDEMPCYKNDGQRKETKEQADKIHEIIKQTYQDSGYNLIKVPWVGNGEETLESHSKRAGLILSETIKYLSMNGYNLEKKK